MERFKLNDKIGSPAVFKYSEIGKCSPNTLRYINIAGYIKEIFGDLTGTHICEIGGGFGGQALVLDTLIRFKSYTIFDLAPVNLLINKYLESFLMNGAYSTSTINRAIGDIEYDLIISNFAFSELPIELQKKYITKILIKAKRGFLIMNSGMPDSSFNNGKLIIDQLKELLPKFEVIYERPKEFGRYIITWGR